MGEEGISIADAKEVKMNVDFDEVDLLSDEERAAMAEDTDTEAELQQQQAEEDAKAEADKQAAEAQAKADEEAAKKAQEEADAEKEKQIAEADAKVAEEKAKAESQAQDASAAAQDQETKTPGESGASDDKDAAIIVPPTSPPLAMKGLTPQEIEDTRNQLENARKRFKEGEIDYDAYTDERMALEKKLWTHDIAVQVTTESIEAQWQYEQQSFLSAEENGWITDDDVVYGAFSSLVNGILSTEEGSVMPGTQILEMARKQVAARFSPTKTEDDAAAKEEADKQAALKRAKASQANKAIPQTLADIPAAEQEEGTGEFDWIDKLEGDKYEEAVANLSEAQLARYENSR